MLDKTCDFINKFRESCIILEKNLEIVIKQEPIEIDQFQEPCDIFKGKVNTEYRSAWDILAGKKEITVEILKNETCEDFDFTEHNNDDTDQFTLNTNSNKDRNTKQQIKTVKSKIKISKKCKDAIGSVKSQRHKSKNYTNRTSRIASSLLEGKFTWTGGRWR